MVQTCFRMTVQARLSELLRKCAESTLMGMIHHIFSNCNTEIKASSEEPSEHVIPSDVSHNINSFVQ